MQVNQHISNRPIPLLFFLCLLVLAGCKIGLESDQSSPSGVSGNASSKGSMVFHGMGRQVLNPDIRRWAVVVGISDYKYDTRWNPQEGLRDLQYAHRDAEALAEFLLSPRGGAFDPDRVLLLTDARATIKEFRRGIGDFLAQSLEEDIVFLFFSGHGVPDPRRPTNLYLACHDTEPGNYYGTALPMWELDTALEKTILSRKIFVLIDACHSAGVGGLKGGSPARRLNAYMKRLVSSRPGVTKITASRSNELSQEQQFEDGGYGVFTYYLLQGLQGAADDDGDGFVTMQEAYDYLYDQVRSKTRHAQHPWASAYVSSDIPVGITNRKVLKSIQARQGKVETESGLVSESKAEEPVRDASQALLGQARSRLSAGDFAGALGKVDKVLYRDDAHKIQALVLKIEILLEQGKMVAAENVEEQLVRSYPNHPLSTKGSELVYEHVLNRMKGKNTRTQIKLLSGYLERHPEGVFFEKARQKREQIQASVRSGYTKDFQEHLTLARELLHDKRFDRAEQELVTAKEVAAEADSVNGMTLDISKLKQLRHELATARKEALSETWTEPVTGMEFVWVPGGCYQMGQTQSEKEYLIKAAGQEAYEKYLDDELPRHEVCVDGFWMGKHEVTRGQFRDFIQATDHKTSAERAGYAWIFSGSKWEKNQGYDWKKVGYTQDDTHPVVCVSWEDGQAFAKWLSGKTGKAIRLPTEAEWEYASRAGTRTLRFWGRDDSDACRYANVADKGHNWSPNFPCDDGYKYTAPVGHYRANAFGLYDMLGNVWEWCRDVYDSDAYSRHSRNNPVITSGGSYRVLRGGSWNYNPRYVRAANRFRDDPGYTYYNLGFRLCFPRVR